MLLLFLSITFVLNASEEICKKKEKKEKKDTHIKRLKVLFRTSKRLTNTRSLFLLYAVSFLLSSSLLLFKIFSKAT